MKEEKVIIASQYISRLADLHGRLRRLVEITKSDAISGDLQDTGIYELITVRLEPALISIDECVMAVSRAMPAIVNLKGEDDDRD